MNLDVEALGSMINKATESQQIPVRIVNAIILKKRINVSSYMLKSPCGGAKGFVSIAREYRKKTEE